MSRFVLSIFLSAFLVLSCQSTPKVEALDPAADVSNEISNLSSKIVMAESEQVNVLAPKSFREAKENLRDAERRRDKGSSNTDILKSVEKGYAWIKRANDVAQPRKEDFKEILQKRSEAVNAGAPQYAGTEFSRADDAFESYTSDESSVKVDLETREKIQKNYIQSHVTAVKNHYLAQARASLKQARTEGAAVMVPKTFAEVEKKIQSAEVYADANYFREAEVAEVAKKAQESADRLLILTRDARANKNKTPEQLALDQESANQEIEKTKKEAQEKGQALSKETAEVRALKSLDEREASARSMFTAEEADVLRTNDGMVIRLKGLHFGSGKAALSPADYQLLSKAREAVKALGATTFVVEGHTDALGSSSLNKHISKERAEAVKQYFESTGDLQNVSIVSEGVGDQKPISSNKTKEGRAQNRRVDLILKDQPVAR